MKRSLIPIILVVLLLFSGCENIAEFKNQATTTTTTATTTTTTQKTIEKIDYTVDILGDNLHRNMLAIGITEIEEDTIGQPPFFASNENVTFYSYDKEIIDSCHVYFTFKSNEYEYSVYGLNGDNTIDDVKATFNNSSFTINDDTTILCRLIK